MLDFVDFKLFLTSSHLNVYKLIKDLSKVSDFIFNNTNFSPHYISYRSLEYDQKSNKTIPNCISKGLYCAMPRYDLGVLDGRDIIIEDIRQKCIYNIASELFKSEKFTQKNCNKKLYFDYMSNFYDKCLNKTEKRFNYYCSKEVMEETGLNSNLVLECVTKSYFVDLESNIVDLDNNNKILEEEKKVRSIYQIKILPSVLINNRTISGALNGNNILEAICSAFKNKPVSCFHILSEYLMLSNTEQKEEGFSVAFYFFIILLLIALNIAIFFICRIYMNRRIEEKIENVDINGTINSVVTNYLRLKNDTNPL